MEQEVFTQSLLMLQVKAGKLVPQCQTDVSWVCY
jgi:hypothetical protein